MSNGFPPASKNHPKTSDPAQVTGERGPISTGNGGIPASLKIKNAGTRDTPGVDKSVQAF